MTVVTAWPGATAQEMQDQVAEPLEKRLQELRWYDRSETFTRPGLAFTTLTLRDQTPPKDVPEHSIRRAKRSRTRRANCRKAWSAFVDDEFGDVSFGLYALKAKGVPQRDLAREAERLRQQLLHVPGVDKVKILGERPERIYVESAQERLATLGVSPRAIFDALAKQNLMTPAGSIESKAQQVVVRLDGAFDDLSKIRGLPIVANGARCACPTLPRSSAAMKIPATFLIRSEGEPR
jgi:multidrug efflux pump subunit AcrB